MSMSTGFSSFPSADEGAIKSSIRPDTGLANTWCPGRRERNRGEMLHPLSVTRQLVLPQT
jgi:hypothetical protein